MARFAGQSRHVRYDARRLAKPKRRAGSLPGFHFDARTGVAHFAIIVPGTRSRARRRTTVENVKDAIDESTRYHAFKKETLERASPAKPRTFRAYVEAWWSLISARTNGGTPAMETTLIDRHLVPFFGDYRLEEINGALLKDFLAIKKRDGRLDRKKKRHDYSPTTLNRTRGLLVRILHDAVEREELAAFPIKGKIRAEKADVLELEMSPDERAAFLSAFDDEAGFRRVVAAERGKGKVVTSRHFGAARSFGGGRRGDSESTGKFFGRLRRAKPLFVVALETAFPVPTFSG